MHRSPVRPRLSGLLLALILPLPAAHAVTPPGIMHHQGRIVVNGENFNGTGYFKFYIGSLDDQFEWSNDNSSLGSDEPNTAVPVTVTNGHYSVPLGDTTFHANMNNPIPASGFADKDELYLHIWFSTDNVTFERLLPDRRLATSAYAFSAAEINGGSVKNPSFVGTTGNTAMDVTINGLRAMRFQPGNLSDDLRFPSPAGPGEGTVSIVGGYEGNSIAAGVDGATISGGGGVFVDEFVQFQLPNTIGIFAHFSTISGGRENEISAAYGTIGGGKENQVSDGLGTVSGGDRNIAGQSASVGGGRNNQATGRRATIPGGDDNRATGRESFAAGRGAQALHDSTFVWADSNGIDSVVPFPSTAAEQFLIRAGGGVGIGTNAPGSAFEVLSSNAVGSTNDNGIISATNGIGAIVIDQDDIQRYESADTPGTLYLNYFGGNILLSASGRGATTTVYGTFDNLSDRESKEDFAEVDPHAVLNRLVGLPLATWRYKGAAERRHIGPVSQDFHAAFDELLNLNSPDTAIAPLDEAGIAFASIQALHHRMEAENARLQRENFELRERLERLEQVVEQLADPGL
jgi:hypothetical protein